MKPNPDVDNQPIDRPGNGFSGPPPAPAGEQNDRTPFESTDQGFCIIEVLFDEAGEPADYCFVEVNPAFERQAGLPEATGKPMLALAPGHERPWFEIYGHVALTGEPARFEHRADGRWFEAFAFRVGDPAQHRVGLLFNDITARKHVEAVLRAGRERQAFLLRLSDALRILTDPEEIRRTAMRQLAGHLGVMRASFFEVGEDQNRFTQSAAWEDNAPPLPDQMQFADFGPAIRDAYLAGQNFIVEDTESDPRLEAQRATYRAIGVRSWIGLPLVKDGRLVSVLGIGEPVARRWTETEIRLVKEVGERLWAYVERARAEEALRESEKVQKLLVAELQHRVRNILAVIRSVFGRTVEAGGDAQDVADHFIGRLDALARTQVIATRNLDGYVDLEGLIRDELLSVGAADSDRLRIEGPDVTLPSRAAELLGLAIHELTINSVKYGALRTPDAELEIRWSTNMGYGAPRRLDLTWSEQGVPTIVIQPQRQGFGRELIEEALPYRLGAETVLDFRGGGVFCRISLPLAEGTGP